MIVYISIGNSDDKLTQQEWADLLGSMWRVVHTDAAITIHGEWYSAPTSAYQNACWCLEINPEKVFFLKEWLRKVAATYGQDSIAWATATTEFLEPATTRAADHG